MFKENMTCKLGPLVHIDHPTLGLKRSISSSRTEGVGYRDRGRAGGVQSGQGVFAVLTNQVQVFS